MLRSKRALGSLDAAYAPSTSTWPSKCTVRSQIRSTQSGQRQLLEERLLLFEHGAHLARGRAVNVRHGLALIPVVEVGVLFLDGLEPAPCLSILA